ncbi:MAG: thioredoxin domain-containing protein, partial [Cocleimonas sp.]|nr:thioredoxin domain-containing protein [Cocleimonas sp.]
MKPFVYYLFFFVAFLLSSTSYANDLKNNASPYLALHGNDPVHWMKWSKATLDKAKKENKIILVSVGYFSCHWCHVMQRESYQSKTIATLLNKNFIAVKVDRELNPVLDKRLIEFVQITTGSAGWPLNVFLTPEAYPLVGATYMPHDNFVTVLTRLQKRWKKEAQTLSDMAKNRNETLTNMLETQERTSSNKSISNAASHLQQVIMKNADTLQGGFSNRKFPSTPQLSALLAISRQTKNTEIDEFLKLTLNQMARKGLHDDIGGGFYRYTVDPAWETPHFEKMLYTNALMPLLYLEAAERYNNPEYRQVALETLHFVIESMKGKGNAYISSLSAVDDNNEEGGFYLWSRDQLAKILNKTELALAYRVWNLNRVNELPTGNLPRRDDALEDIANALDTPLQLFTKQIDSLRHKLKTYRNKNRGLPRDTKLLASQNGMLLGAFAKGVSYDQSLYNYGDRLSHFLQRLWNGTTLRRSAADATAGTLDDYATVAWGLLSWG